MARGVEAAPVRDADAWVRFALGHLTRVPGVHRVGVALSEGGGRRLLFTASDRDNDLAIDWCEIDAYEDVPLTAAVRTGTAVAGTLAELADRCPDFVLRQSPETHAVSAVPLCAAGQVVGAFVLFYSDPEAFDRSHLARLGGLGASLGAALRTAQRMRSRPSRRLADEPVPPGARSAACVVVADPRAVSLARQFLRRTLAAWDVDDDVVDTAVLCLSELVTNAIIHTGGGCEVRVVLDRGVLTTTVRDDGAGSIGPSESPGETAGEPLAVHGRGLRLVEALTARWGSDLDAVGTTVWFELEP